jgi:hypothetical protein
VLGVWYAIAYLERDQCGSAGATLKTWYPKWYAVSIEGVELNIDSARGLAMPCQLFDHAAAFARVTKWLAYNHIGHVKERPPKGFKGSKGLHLPPGQFVGKWMLLCFDYELLTPARPGKPRTRRAQDHPTQEPL